MFLAKIKNPRERIARIFDLICAAIFLAAIFSNDDERRNFFHRWKSSEKF